MSEEEVASVLIAVPDLPSSSDVEAAAPPPKLDFVAELKKSTEANFQKLVENAIEEVKKQLKAKAEGGFDRHEVTLASDRLAKAVTAHFLVLPGLTVSIKGRSLVLEW